MEIYILRHGRAAAPGSGPDVDRVLTQPGRQALRRTLERARAAGMAPSLILTSPYRRAVETAEIAGEVLGYRGAILPIESLAPDGSPVRLWEELRSRPEENAILLVGHEPLLSHFLAYVLDAPALRAEIEAGCLLRVHAERLAPHPSAELKWMLAPSLA